MSERTLTTEATKIYCDEGECEQDAAGTCLFCDKDLCPTHGASAGWFSSTGFFFFVCEDDRSRPMSDLADAPRDEKVRAFGIRVRTLESASTG